MEAVERMAGDAKTGRVMTAPETVREALVSQLASGELKVGDRLLSITAYARKHGVSRETVEKAYNLLKIDGVVEAVAGKGNFVVAMPDRKLRVLLLFNKLSEYKRQIYEGIISGFGDKVESDLCVHHYDPGILGSILDRHLGKYDRYVLMPHFFAGTEEIWKKQVRRIPSCQLVLLDRDAPGMERMASVVQDFKMDSFFALASIREKIAGYGRVELVMPVWANHPPEIVEGIGNFCSMKGKEFIVSGQVGEGVPESGTLYIVLRDGDLALLLMRARTAGMHLGEDIGVLSFNDTALKELLEISVMSTDFRQMGVSVAGLILQNKKIEIKNPFGVVPRGSI